MTKPRVLVIHPLVFVDRDELESKFVVEQLQWELPAKEQELKEKIKAKDGVICFSTDIFNREVLQSTDELKVISSVSAGLDHVDLVEATKRGIYVTNTPRALTDSVAEFAIAVLLAITKRIPEGDRMIRSGRWKGPPKGRPGLTYMIGPELKGKTLGIVGLGRIGSAIARKVKGFGLRVFYYDIVKRPEIENELGIRSMSLERLLMESDFVALCVSLTAQTRGLIGARQLGTMKNTAYLVNVSRGPIVDEGALARALKRGRIAGAALDVFATEPIRKDHPLASLDNVVLTPHIASATLEARRAMVFQAIDNITKLFEGRIPMDLANPEAMEKRPLHQLRMLGPNVPHHARASA